MVEQQVNRVVESLLTTAERLEQASSGFEVRGAVRDGLLGLEYHLDTLARELARDPNQAGAFEPALRHRALKVESTLRALMVNAWELLVMTDTQLGEPTVAADLAKELRAAEHEEISLVFDQLLTPQAID